MIARGVFTSVADLRHQRMKYIRAHAERARPIRWTYTDAKRRVSATRIIGTAHYGRPYKAYCSAGCACIMEILRLFRSSDGTSCAPRRLSYMCG